MGLRCLFVIAAVCLLAPAVPAVDWFDAGIGDYTSWPPASDVPRGGAWSASDAGIAPGDLATLSGEAPQAALELEAEDAALDFQASALDLGEEAESVDIVLTLAFNAFEASSLPAVDPAVKAGAILVLDPAGARLHYLAKDSGADANVWVASSFVITDTAVEQVLTVTLRKTASGVCATYRLGETVVASDVEVHAAESTVSTVRFGGGGRLSSLVGTAESRVVDITVDAASLADTAHLEVVEVRDRDSGLVIQPVDGRYSVPYGAHVAVAFRATKGYRLVGDGVLDLDVASAAIVLNGATPGLVATEEANAFRVTPYVQHPKPTAMSLLWLAQTTGPARVEVWKDGSTDVRILEAVAREDLSADVTGGRFADDNELQYCLARELAYDQSVATGDNYPNYTRETANAGWSMPYTVPCQYRVRLTGLEADTVYRYRVTLDGDGATYENRFRTSPDPQKWRGFKFIYYSDSETEPADNDPTKGLTTDWDVPDGMTRGKTYHVTQTEAYASNICAAVDFGTELIVMAGDLAQKGSRQCDWDEFWRHNAGPLNDPAGSIPILATPGNHDYYDYGDGGVCGSRKYLSYFEYEPNGTAVDADQQERFHRVDYGPVTFIFLDGNNGNDADITQDTNLKISRNAEGPYRVGIGCRAPDFNPGTPQYAWLEAQLADAQRKSAFTFIVTHQCPFSVGDHGREPGDYSNNTDFYSGRPLRVLLPLMHKYGVDGWFAGHDEMMERSVTEGTELRLDGTEAPHSFFVWDMGIAGDGLRGTKMIDNPNERYRAHVNSQEVWENGLQVEGGKHYGHLEVTIDQTSDGKWRATFDPIYVFFSRDAQGNPLYGGVRHYDDRQVRVSNRNAGTPPAPQPVTKTSVDVSTYVPTKMPQGLVTTFWDGPLSRGFAWQTDTSVTETKLWLLKGEFGPDDGNTFVAEGTSCTGTYTEKNEPGMNCHRVHVTGLEPGAVYSCRLGGNGHYVYGRFTTDDEPSSLTAVYFGDTQSKDATQLYKAENAVAAAVRTAGGLPNVDLAIAGGDIFDVSALANAHHVVYGDAIPADCKCLKWGLMADLIDAWIPGVPWIAVPGNHDYGYYGTLTAVDLFTTGIESYGCGCSSVDLGDVHFVQLPFLGTWNETRKIAYAKVAQWLEADLARASSAKWKVVCMHWGLNTTGDHGQESGIADYVGLFAPIISAGHVDLVLQAHDHTFSKTVPYLWDTAGYTASASDGAVLNLNPKAVTISGEKYDSNPRGTYYVATGASGHRVGEDTKGYSLDHGDYSYTRRDPAIAIGTTAVASPYKALGEYASGDFNRQMFGVLKIKGEMLRYDFYVAEEDGSVTLVDKVRISKRPEDAPKPGFLLLLE